LTSLAGELSAVTDMSLSKTKELKKLLKCMSHPVKSDLPSSWAFPKLQQPKVEYDPLMTGTLTELVNARPTKIADGTTSCIELVVSEEAM
jgi:hypothetical protein